MGPLRNGDGSEYPPDKIIDDLVAANTVTIFSKTYCPHCKRIKEFFKAKSIEYEALELDIMGQLGKDIQATLLDRTGQSTVPSVWINGKFIGKNFELKLDKNNLVFIVITH